MPKLKFGRLAPQTATLMALLATASPAWPDEPETRPKRTTLTVAPYVWVPTIQSTSGIGPLSVSTKVTPKDFAQGIRGGGMGYLRIDDGRRFVYVESIYSDYKNARFRPFFNQALASELLFVEGGAGLIRTVRLGSRKVRLAPYAGVQHFAAKARVAGPLVGELGGRGQWTSPAAGIVAELPLARRLDLIGKFDVAGYAGNGVRFVNGMAVLQYRLSSRFSLDAGYRAAWARYPGSTGLDLDMSGQGPIVGLRYAIPLK